MPSESMNTIEYQPHAASLNRTAWSRDGKFLAAGADDRVVVITSSWNRTSGCYCINSRKDSGALWNTDRIEKESE